MNKKLILTITILAFGSILIGACAPVIPVASAMDASAQSDNTTANGSSGMGNGHSGATGAQAPTYAIGEISQAEVDGLIFMREEEKLARDVYLSLYDVWGLRPFSNISVSEQTHTNQIATLLGMYEIPDPVVDDTIGVFVNADLQALYNDLIEKGNTSLVDAIEVGAAIEEIDILDLLDYVDDTEEANLDWVYANLLAGSENHLRAFANQYEMQTGEAYVPQYLSQAAYDAIISASNGRGGGGGQGQGGGHGGNGGGGNGGGQHGKGNNG